MKNIYTVLIMVTQPMNNWKIISFENKCHENVTQYGRRLLITVKENTWHTLAAMYIATMIRIISTRNIRTSLA
jgi:uncharacterized DUF497 family protein